MPPHPLTNFQVQKCYQNKAKFNDVYSRNNLFKIQDRAYIMMSICLDEYESIRTYWIASYVNAENVTYFDSFRVEHIPKEIRNIIGNKNIATKNTHTLLNHRIYILIYILYKCRIHAYNSIMYGGIFVLDLLISC